MEQESEVRKDWQKTKSEYALGSSYLEKGHKEIVIGALKNGETIPVEVLAEYPDVEQYAKLQRGLPGNSIDVHSVGDYKNGLLKEFKQGERPVLLWRGREKGVVADGFILIKDKDVADKVLGPIEKRLLGKADEKEYKEIQRYREGTFPNYEQLFPEDSSLNKKQLKILGYSVYDNLSRDIRAGRSAYLADDDGVVRVDADRLAFILKHIPDAKMYRNKGSKTTPIVFKREGESVGLIMPMVMTEYLPKNLQGMSYEEIEETPYTTKVKTKSSIKKGTKKRDDVDSVTEKITTDKIEGHNILSKAERVKSNDEVSVHNPVGDEQVGDPSIIKDLNPVEKETVRQQPSIKEVKNNDDEEVLTDAETDNLIDGLNKKVDSVDDKETIKDVSQGNETTKDNKPDTPTIEHPIKLDQKEKPERKRRVRTTKRVQSVADVESKIVETKKAEPIIDDTATRSVKEEPVATVEAREKPDVGVLSRYTSYPVTRSVSVKEEPVADDTVIDSGIGVKEEPLDNKRGDNIDYKAIPVFEEVKEKSKKVKQRTPRVIRKKKWEWVASSMNEVEAQRVAEEYGAQTGKRTKVEPESHGIDPETGQERITYRISASEKTRASASTHGESADSDSGDSGDSGGIDLGIARVGKGIDKVDKGIRRVSQYASRRAGDTVDTTARMIGNLTDSSPLPRYIPPNFNISASRYKPLDYKPISTAPYYRSVKMPEAGQYYKPFKPYKMLEYESVLYRRPKKKLKRKKLLDRRAEVINTYDD